MSDHDERRNNRRVQLKQTVSAADENKLILVDIVDITVGGVSMTSDVGFAQGAKFFVLFPGAGDLQENEIEAQVLRCGEEEGRFNIAAKFIHVNEKYMEDIVALVKT